MNPLLTKLQSVFTLLQKTQPRPEEYDVAWYAPYYIPSAGKWFETYFSLYQGRLFAQLSLDFEGERYALSWAFPDGEWVFEDNFGGVRGQYDNDEKLWCEALRQIETRLTSMLKNPVAYNRGVVARIPNTCRTGKIQRALTWPKGARAPVGASRLRRLEQGLEKITSLPPLKSMTVSEYLKVTGVAYDAAFRELRELSPRDKYKRRADGRHGGLLELDQDDPQQFSEWLLSKEWEGAHPWEIVFGHPHGILLSPEYNEELESWSFLLSVHSARWYSDTVKMALALMRAQVPFEFENIEEVLEALRGTDEVEVGYRGERGGVWYEELKEQRPDSIDRIKWDPIPELGPITPNQVVRVQIALRGEAAPPENYEQLMRVKLTEA